MCYQSSAYCAHACDIYVTGFTFSLFLEGDHHHHPPMIMLLLATGPTGATGVTGTTGVTGATGLGSVCMKSLLPCCKPMHAIMHCQCSVNHSVLDCATASVHTHCIIACLVSITCHVILTVELICLVGALQSSVPSMQMWTIRSICKIQYVPRATHDAMMNYMVPQATISRM